VIALQPFWASDSNFLLLLANNIAVPVLAFLFIALQPFRASGSNFALLLANDIAVPVLAFLS
jgi:hypothetical protein